MIFTALRVAIISIAVYVVIGNMLHYALFGVLAAAAIQIIERKNIAARMKKINSGNNARALWFMIDMAIWPGSVSSYILRCIFGSDANLATNG